MYWGSIKDLKLDSPNSNNFLDDIFEILICLFKFKRRTLVVFSNLVSKLEFDI